MWSPTRLCVGSTAILNLHNDLPNISDKLEFYLFADDTNTYENESLEKLEKTINKEVKNLYLWLIVNRLAQNIEKANFLGFHPFNKPLEINATIKIHKKAITESYLELLG